MLKDYTIPSKDYTMLAGTTPIPNPNFPVITVVNRDLGYSTVPLKFFQDRIDQFAILGKTDGVAYIYSDISSNRLIVYRNWIDTNAANEWILFITSMNDPLVVDNKFYT